MSNAGWFPPLNEAAHRRHKANLPPAYRFAPGQMHRYDERTRWMVEQLLHEVDGILGRPGRRRAGEPGE